MSSASRLLVCAAVTCALLGLVSCSGPPEHDTTASTTEAPQAPTASATTRDITDAVSLNATAQAGARYTITAPSEGQLSVRIAPIAATVDLPGAHADRRVVAVGAGTVPTKPQPSDPDDPSDNAAPPDDNTDDAETENRSTPAYDPREYDFWFIDSNGAERELPVPDTARSVSVLVPESTRTLANTPIIEVEESALLLQAEPDPSQVLRIGTRPPESIKAQVEGSTGPSDCLPTDRLLSRIDDRTLFTCRLPSAVPLVAGATAKIVLVLETRPEVTALPIEAVAGTIEQGSVYLKGDPDTEVPVELGITDGVYIEIRSGIDRGDEVLIPSPSILEQ